MSFPVAVQSAVFYFIACTPCAKVRHRHRAKQRAKREREEKLRIETEQPHLYRHPDPFNTNPYWTEEIMMGPSLPKKGRGRDSASRNPSQRGLTSVAGREDGTTTQSSLAASSTATAPSMGDPALAAPTAAAAPTITTTKTSRLEPPSTEHRETVSAPPTRPVSNGGSSIVPPATAQSSPTVVPEDAASLVSDDWNHKRYQREDEELWGHEAEGMPGTWTGQRLMHAIRHASTSAGRYMESKLGMHAHVTDEDRQKFYSPQQQQLLVVRNPPVNDYHPPVVSSKPAYQDGHRWMLQPPPPAKVMEGKIPVRRSGSLASMQSRRTLATSSEGPALGRLVGERAVEARIRKGETPGESDNLLSAPGLATRPGSRRTATGSTRRAKSQATTRSRSLSMSTESDESDDGAPRRRRRRANRSAVTTPPLVDSDDEEAEQMSHSIESLSNAALTGHAAQRPRLPTILSSDAADADTAATRFDRAASTATPLREVQNSSPGPEGQKLRPSGASIDSGLALQV